jgi:ATP-binding cassette subfamily B protein
LGFLPQHLPNLLIVFFAVLTGKFALEQLRFRLNGFLAEKFSYQLQLLAFTLHLQADAQQYESRDMGRSLLRFSGDFGNLQRLLSKGILQSAADLLLLATGWAIIGFFHYQLALCIAGMAVFGLFVLRRSIRKLAPVELRKRQQKAGILAFISTCFQNLSGIQALNRTTRVVRRFEQKLKQMQREQSRYNQIRAFSNALPAFWVHMQVLCVLIFGVWQHLDRYTLFVSALILITWRTPLTRLLRSGVLWQKAGLSLEKLESLRYVSTRVTSPQKALEGKATLLNVKAVGYQTGEHPMLQECTFSLQTGEMLCLLMPPGTGKTTLIKLLVGLYVPTKGVIEWDNIPALEVSPHSIRKQAAFVSDIFPLTGKNLLDALSNSSNAAAMQQAESAFLHWQSHLSPLQHVLPKKLHQLSSSQQKILQCLRAVLADKPFILLDDPFTGLDSTTIAQMSQLMRAHGKPKAVLWLTSQPGADVLQHWAPVRMQVKA